MKRQQRSSVAVALVFAGALGLHACGGGDGQQPGVATAPPGALSDPSAERQVITLTGCLQQGVAPGEFTLMSVATGGVVEPAPSGQRGAADRPLDPEARASLVAASSYRLVSADEDHDLAEHVGQRVTVSGRLAVPSPADAAPAAPSQGTPVASDRTSATVAAQAPPLRGFYVTSIRKVADSCSAEAGKGPDRR